MSEPTALAHSETRNITRTIMQAVQDPSIDPARLREFLTVAKDFEELELKREARDAQKEYNIAFAKVKLSLPSIPKNGIIPDNSGAVRSRFARRDDLHKALTPLLSQHGFAASFSFRDAGPARMICSLRLTHSSGHSEVYEAAGPWDMEIPKASVHQRSRGAQSFMKRNLMLDAFDILDEDVDNNASPEDMTPITRDQVRVVEQKIIDFKLSEPLVLKWLKSPTVEEIPTKDYQRLIDELDRKGREKGLLK